MGRVFVLGSLNVDLVTRVARHPQPGETVLGDQLDRLAGGKGANQAVSAAAAGAEVVMVGAVGDDSFGRLYRARLERLGVDVRGVGVHPEAATGAALIVVDTHGENTIVVAPGANRLAGDSATILEEMRAGDVLLVQLEVPLDAVTAACERAATQGARVVLNLAPYAELPPHVVSLGDPVVVNVHEARQLGASRASARSLLVTLGAEGAEWDGLHLPALGVPSGGVRDTTGAGDAFCGALAAALARGEAQESALRAALAAGAAAVQRPGAQADPPLG